MTAAKIGVAALTFPCGAQWTTQPATVLSCHKHDAIACVSDRGARAGVFMINPAANQILDLTHGRGQNADGSGQTNLAPPTAPSRPGGRITTDQNL